MKKLLLFSAGLILLASCSEEQDFYGSNEGTEKIELNVKASGADVVVTKAAKQRFENGDKITVLGLTSNGENWAANAGLNVNRLFNVGQTTGTVQSDFEGTSLLFGSVSGGTGETFFYPMEGSADIAYVFFGAFPQSTYTIGNDNAYAEYNMDGVTDIMAAYAAPDNGEDGYNTKFFRTYDVTPSLDFKHKLAKLDFEAYIGDEQPTDATGVKITSVKIKNVNNKVRLEFAKSKVNEGNLEYSGDLTSAGNVISDGLSIFSRIDEPFMGVDLGQEAGAEEFLGTVMLPAQDSYLLEVVLEPSGLQEGVNASAITKTMTLYTEPDMAEEAPAFEEGKAYTVRLKVYGWQTITIDPVEITTWEDAGIIEQPVDM